MNRPFFATLLFLSAVFCGTLCAQEPTNGSASTTALETAMVEAIARAEKSVATVVRVRRETAGETLRLDLREDPFGHRPTPSAPPSPTDPDFIPNQYGSGVIVDRRGWILTTDDILGDDSNYYVTVAGRRVYRAVVRAADPRSRLAVLAIETADANFTPIALGDGASLRKGQFVIALGNPNASARDGQASASWGIVANLHRKSSAALDPSVRPSLHHYGELIQTDARLNFGTGGGPLLNLRGEMVGLCLPAADAAGAEASGGYAIPVDPMFRRAAALLVQGREVEYGFLGVQSANLAANEILSGLQGVRVSQIIPGTPAARCGLRSGDVIATVNDAAVWDTDGLAFEAGRWAPGAAVRLGVIRDGRRQVISATLGKCAVRGRKVVTTADPAWRGLRVDYATAVVDAEGRFPNGMATVAEAVAVAEVSKNSPAWRAGLRRGMLITHVGDEPVRMPKEFAALVARDPGPVRLRVAGDEKNPSHTVEPEI